MSIRIERLSGPSLIKGIPHVARLRMTVFREWPYLYDGDPTYEENYLADQGSIIVAAIDGEVIIGAATGAPLGEHTEEFVPLFTDRGYDPDDVFYCGESVLLPQYRGRGIGHDFFSHREAHARELRTGMGKPHRYASFCGVIRDLSDPRCPTNYRPLDDFWHKRGYRKVEGMIGSYSWREVGEIDETRNDMQFWIKELDQPN